MSIIKSILLRIQQKTLTEIAYHKKTIKSKFNSRSPRHNNRKVLKGLIFSYILQLIEMIQNADPFRDYTGVLPEQTIGKQEVIIPFHVIKYCLREGGGPKVKTGMSIQCVVNVYLIDGSQVVKGNRTTKYLYGRKRLIKGLQLGLRGVRKDQKLRLIISSDYAYGDQADIRLIPPNSKLIFQIDILEFTMLSLDKMNDLQVYYQVYNFLDISDKYLRKKDEANALSFISQAYIYAKKIRNYKSTILKKILLKWGNILYHRQQYQNAFAVISQIDKYDIFLQDYFRLQIKILQAMKNTLVLQKIVQKMYNDNIYDNSIKRICVNYYKEVENWQKLKKLNGYSFKKDQFTQIKVPQEKNNGIIFRCLY